MRNGVWAKNSIIELEPVSKKYQMGEVCVTALDCISLRVIPGEFLVVLGPSGSGKTTPLNLIGALDTPSPDDISMSGQHITRVNSSQRLAACGHSSDHASDGIGGAIQ